MSTPSRPAPMLMLVLATVAFLLGIAAVLIVAVLAQSVLG